jgi:hypothetical protein
MFDVFDLYAALQRGLGVDCHEEVRAGGYTTQSIGNNPQSGVIMGQCGVTGEEPNPCELVRMQSRGAGVGARTVADSCRTVSGTNTPPVMVYLDLFVAWNLPLNFALCGMGEVTFDTLPVIILPVMTLSLQGGARKSSQ